MGAGVVLTGPHGPSLACAARFRATNLLAYLSLPGLLALTCTLLHLLSLTWFLLEETPLDKGERRVTVVVCRS